MGDYTFKIFYSWRIEDSKYNKNFIGDCIKAALKSIPLNDKSYQYDRDIKNCSGNIDIVQKILEKIENSDVFISDITPITKIGKKSIPNPNVMFELGYAVKTLGWERIILVMNESDYTWNNEMPFDLSSPRRKPICFEYNDTLEKDKKNIKTKLIGQLKEAITLISRQAINSENLYPCCGIHLCIPENYLTGAIQKNKDYPKLGDEYDLHFHSMELTLINTSSKIIDKITSFVIDKKGNEHLIHYNKNGSVVEVFNGKLLPEGQLGLHCFFSNDTCRDNKIHHKKFLDDYIPFEIFLKIDERESKFKFETKDYLNMVNNRLSPFLEKNNVKIIWD